MLEVLGARLLEVGEDRGVVDVSLRIEVGVGDFDGVRKAEGRHTAQRGRLPDPPRSSKKWLMASRAAGRVRIKSRLPTTARGRRAASTVRKGLSVGEAPSMRVAC